MFIWHSVSVLLQEAFRLVRDVDGIVSNSERRVAETRFLEDVLIPRFDELLV